MRHTLSMRPWMLEAPCVQPRAADLAAFGRALEARDPGLLGPDVPRWLFLDWLTAQGLLLHGSPAAGVAEFEVRQAVDLSPDGFSNRAGVYATSDGLWALIRFPSNPLSNRESANLITPFPATVFSHSLRSD